jgi:hypothetical protein
MLKAVAASDLAVAASLAAVLAVERALEALVLAVPTEVTNSAISPALFST